MVVTNYRFKGQTLPKSKEEEILRYVNDGIPTGGFMAACLANDLTGAFGRADIWSTELMPVIVAFIYNKIPSYCHGSWEVVENWKGVEEYERAYEESLKKGTG